MTLNYYEQEPEDNTFLDVVADITHRCNMTCSNCYIPNRDYPDMNLENFTNFLDRLKKRITIRIIGAEPTMNPHCEKFIAETNARGHKCVLLTNGLRVAHKPYLDKLKAAGLRFIYLSMNGVDNDDWYEAIDELRCAKKKLQAFENIANSRMTIDIGTIIAKGVNEEAPGRLLRLIDKHEVKNCVLRIKNIGAIGNYLKSENVTKAELVDSISDQMNISKDWIEEYTTSGINPLNNEPNTLIFPMERTHKGLRGRWIKVADWSGDIPDADSRRRGRITEDFKIAPFFEHVKANEGKY